MERGKKGSRQHVKALRAAAERSDRRSAGARQRAHTKRRGEERTARLNTLWKELEKLRQTSHADAERKPVITAAAVILDKGQERDEAKTSEQHMKHHQQTREFHLKQKV